MDEVDLILSFKGSLNVSENEFIYTMEDLEIPHNITMFIVKAENVELLRLAVIINEVPVTQTIESTNGFATISRNDIHPGKYWVQISGIPSYGSDSVMFNVTAQTTIFTDNLGEYTASYDITGFPAGDFMVKADSLTKKIVLRKWKDSPPKKYNLVIKPFKIPEKFIQGKELELVYEITNLGEDVSGFFVQFKVENEILEQKKINMLSVNETILFKVFWTPKSSGIKVIQTVVDPTNLIDETEELDNLIEQMIEVKEKRDYLIYLIILLPTTIIFFLLARYLRKNTP